MQHAVSYVRLSLRPRSLCRRTHRVHDVCGRVPSQNAAMSGSWPGKVLGCKLQTHGAHDRCEDMRPSRRTFCRPILLVLKGLLCGGRRHARAAEQQHKDESADASGVHVWYGRPGISEKPQFAGGLPARPKPPAAGRAQCRTRTNKLKRTTTTLRTVHEHACTGSCTGSKGLQGPRDARKGSGRGRGSRNKQTARA